MASFATVTDLRDTARFTRRVEESSEPIQVMKGAERKMVVMNSETYERFQRLEKQLAFEAKLMEAEADTRAGRVRPMTDIQRDMRAKYGA